MYAGWDFVFYALLLVGVVLWSLLSRTLRRRHQPFYNEPAPAVPETIPAPWSSEETAQFPPDRRLGGTGPPPLGPDREARERPRAIRVRSRARRWHSRAELRRALADMVVLGPPRALAPWDTDGAAGDPGNSRG